MSAHTAPDHRNATASAWSLAALLLALLLGTPARAANPDDVPNYRRTPGSAPAEKRPDQPGFPAFPRTEDLVRLDSEQIDSAYEYWVDLESVSLDRVGVVRYTLVMRSPKGAANIFFEGFKCDGSVYKTYGYGTREGYFTPYANADWRHMSKERESRARAYLWLLKNRYFCAFDGQRLFALEDIRRKLQGKVAATGEAWKKAWTK